MLRHGLDLDSHSNLKVDCWPWLIDVQAWTWSGFALNAVFRIRIREPVPSWPLDPDPGSGIGFYRIPYLGSRILNPYFWEVSDKVLGKRFYNSWRKAQNFFLQHLKNKIIFNFMNFVATKKSMTTNFFHPSLLLLFLDLGSEIRDPGWVKIRIRDNHPGSTTLMKW